MNMRAITTEVEIDVCEFIDEIDTYDLVDELIGRDYKGIIKLDSVKDQCKFEAIKEKFYDIPESDLDEFLSRY